MRYRIRKMLYRLEDFFGIGEDQERSEKVHNGVMAFGMGFPFVMLALTFTMSVIDFLVITLFNVKGAIWYWIGSHCDINMVFMVLLGVWWFLPLLWFFASAIVRLFTWFFD